MLITAIVFILILSVLVLIHEFGHFFMAKKFNIKVEEFGFGLPPRAFGIKRGETVYSINWLPIGGFVKLYGEDEAGSGSVKKPSATSHKQLADVDRTYFAKPAWQRAIVVGAGVVMNFFLALVIISYLFSIVGVPRPGDKIFISEVADNSPARAAGLKKGDVIKIINGKKITTSQDLVSITKQNAGKKITLTVERARGEIRKIEVTPRKDYPKDQGPMGVLIAQDVKVVKYPWYQAPVVGTVETLKQTWMILSGFGMIFSQLLIQGTAPQGVAGPVGIAQLTGQILEIGPYAILSFVALLSLNLAILNIMPFPALDGGRLLFIFVEIATGRKVNKKFESYAHAIGMMILLGLIALVTFHDIFRLATGQPLLPKIQ
ncbi:RIP metalloprotease RseP [Patescibacteria group bacterium]|nr:RIP metalloprotease RseP [Patescibacteria group bacterium]